MPWAKWEDGERLGLTISMRMWRSFLFPYRTAEFRGYDQQTLEIDLGPWQWHPPDWWPDRSEQ
jgi:hypothetical protein